MMFGLNIAGSLDLELFKFLVTNDTPWARLSWHLQMCDASVTLQIEVNDA